MDSTVKAALVGAAAVIVAAFIPVAFSQHWFSEASPQTPASGPVIPPTLRPNSGSQPTSTTRSSPPRTPATRSSPLLTQMACKPHPNIPRLCLDPSSGSGGQPVTAIATGFSPDVQVQLFFQGKLVGQAISNNEGTARVVFKVPSEVVSGFSGTTFDVSADDSNANNADAIFKAT